MIRPTIELGQLHVNLNTGKRPLEVTLGRTRPSTTSPLYLETADVIVISLYREEVSDLGREVCPPKSPPKPSKPLEIVAACSCVKVIIIVDRSTEYVPVSVGGSVAYFSE